LVRCIQSADVGGTTSRIVFEGRMRSPAEADSHKDRFLLSVAAGTHPEQLSWAIMQLARRLDDRGSGRHGSQLQGGAVSGFFRHRHEVTAVGPRGSRRLEFLASSRPKDSIMSLGLILVIILVIFLLGGFSGRFGGYGYGYGHGGIGVIGIILIILVVLLLLGRI
jgi:Protein of unknown function (DUF3309)